MKYSFLLLLTAVMQNNITSYKGVEQIFSFDYKPVDSWRCPLSVRWDLGAHDCERIHPYFGISIHLYRTLTKWKPNFKSKTQKFSPNKLWMALSPFTSWRVHCLSCIAIFIKWLFEFGVWLRSTASGQPDTNAPPVGTCVLPLCAQQQPIPFIIISVPSCVQMSDKQTIFFLI